MHSTESLNSYMCKRAGGFQLAKLCILNENESTNTALRPHLLNGAKSHHWRDFIPFNLNELSRPNRWNAVQKSPRWNVCPWSLYRMPMSVPACWVQDEKSLRNLQTYARRGQILPLKIIHTKFKKYSFRFNFYSISAGTHVTVGKKVLKFTMLNVIQKTY